MDIEQMIKEALIEFEIRGEITLSDELIAELLTHQSSIISQQSSMISESDRKYKELDELYSQALEENNMRRMDYETEIERLKTTLRMYADMIVTDSEGRPHDVGELARHVLIGNDPNTIGESPC